MNPKENSAMKSATAYFTDDTEQFAANYRSKPSFNDRLNLFQAAVQRSAPIPAKVLDFGCGPGVIATAVSRQGYDVLGTDGSVGMVERSNSAATAADLDNLRFELVSATTAKFPTEHFDVIICSSVIEYLSEDMAVLSHLVDSLKFGGSLLVSVPNARSLIGIAERSVRCLRRFCRLDIGRHFDYSLRHYSPTRFAAQLSSLGLEVQRRTSFEFPLFGHAGVRLSRIHALGAMILFEARRTRLL
jgi:2-polyprenyl-3-methyl-5-hydroxy-6-metoxy-1,4-benzoquinol methylase